MPTEDRMAMLLIEAGEAGAHIETQGTDDKLVIYTGWRRSADGKLEPAELPVLDQEGVPEGYVRRWERSGEWRVTQGSESADRRCRWLDHGVRCGQPSVAALNRNRRGRGRPNWWFYCAEHMYGRAIAGGIVYVSVIRPIGSPQP